PMSGGARNKAGRPARITPRDLCRVLSPPAPAGRGRWPQKPLHRNLPLPRTTTAPARRRAAPPARANRSRALEREDKGGREMAASAAGGVDPLIVAETDRLNLA